RSRGAAPLNASVQPQVEVEPFEPSGLVVRLIEGDDPPPLVEGNPLGVLADPPHELLERLGRPALGVREAANQPPRLSHGVSAGGPAAVGLDVSGFVCHRSSGSANRSYGRRSSRGSGVIGRPLVKFVPVCGAPPYVPMMPQVRPPPRQSDAARQRARSPRRPRRPWP